MTLRAQAYANAALLGVLALLVVLNGNAFSLSFLAFFAFSILFIVSGGFAAAGNRHVLVGTWAAVIGSLIWAMWGMGGLGLMEGGLFWLAIFGYVIAGIVSAMSGQVGLPHRDAPSPPDSDEPSKQRR